jgi:flagellar biosynthesis protein FliR
MSAYLLLFVRVFSFFAVFSSLRAYLRSSGILILSLVTVLILSKGLVSNELPWFEFFKLAAGEIIFGVLLAVPFVFAFECCAMTGRIVDLFRGAQLGEQLNELAGERRSQCEELFNIGILAAVFQTKGHQHIFRVLSASLFNDHPLTLLSAEGIFRFIGVLSGGFKTALILSFPVLFLVLALEIVSAFISKAFPRFQYDLQGIRLPLALGIFLLTIQNSTALEDFFNYVF